jgi:hypothetical protein
MVKITLMVRDPGVHKGEVFKQLRVCLGLEVSRITKAIQNELPIVERKLYDRKDEGFPTRLCELLGKLEKWGVPYESFVMTDSQTLASVDKSILLRVTSERLRNMIDSRAESLEFQRTLGTLQNPE